MGARAPTLGCCSRARCGAPHWPLHAARRARLKLVQGAMGREGVVGGEGAGGRQGSRTEAYYALCVSCHGGGGAHHHLCGQPLRRRRVPPPPRSAAAALCAGQHVLGAGEQRAPRHRRVSRAPQRAARDDGDFRSVMGPTQTVGVTAFPDPLPGPPSTHLPARACPPHCCALSPPLPCCLSTLERNITGPLRALLLLPYPPPPSVLRLGGQPRDVGGDEPLPLHLEPQRLHAARRKGALDGRQRVAREVAPISEQALQGVERALPQAQQRRRLQGGGVCGGGWRA